jgi:hypothetical protein
MQIPDKVKMWKIGPGPGNVKSWNNYEDNNGAYLMCQTNGKYLTWKEMPIGVNLDFISSQQFKTHFRLPDGAERDILSGESVALGIGGGEAFLYYSHRTMGINLEWSVKPIFEWRIIGGEPGTAIPYDSPVAIMNDSVKPTADFLVYFDRSAGMADIGWTTSPEFWDHVLDVAERALVKVALATA